MVMIDIETHQLPSTYLLSVCDTIYSIRGTFVTTTFGAWPNSKTLITPLSMLLVVVGPYRPSRPRPIALLQPPPTVKPEAATAVVELLMMDVRTPDTC
jgi:hypothetical protein